MAKNILICDDAAFMRMMIKDILTKNGYNIVGEAENGAKAVEKYAELKPDLVLMDITMPDMDGIQALKKIKEIDANANVIMGRVLKGIFDRTPFGIISLAGGLKDNAIPREAQAVVFIPDGMDRAFEEEITQANDLIRNENVSKDKNVYIRCNKLADTLRDVLTVESTNRVIDFLELLPNGVMAMSADIAGLVETSLNVGVLRLEQDKLISFSAVRSSIESSKRDLICMLDTLTGLVGGQTSIYGEYPGWQYRTDSRLRENMVNIYKEMFHEDVKVTAIHAGLECGIMLSKMPELDCVSFGPDIYNIHTTEEKLSISSTQRMWEYLLAILKTK